MSIIVSDLPPHGGRYEERLEEVRDFTNIGKTIVEETRSLIQEDVKAQIARLNNDLENVKAIIRGQINSHIQECQRPLQKAQSKIYKDVKDKVETLLATVYSNGMPYTTFDQMLYGLESGDYLGAMQLTADSPFLVGESVPPIEKTTVEQPALDRIELDEDGFPIGTIAIDGTMPVPPDYIPIQRTTKGETIYIPSYTREFVDPDFISVEFGGNSTQIFNPITQTLITPISVPSGSTEPKKEEPKKEERPVDPLEQTFVDARNLSTGPVTNTFLGSPPVIDQQQQEGIDLLFRWFQLVKAPDKETQMRELSEQFKQAIGNLKFNDPNLCENLKEYRDSMQKFLVLLPYILAKGVKEILGQFEEVRQQDKGLVKGIVDVTTLGLLSDRTSLSLTEQLSKIPLTVLQYSLDAFINLVTWTTRNARRLLSTNDSDFGLFGVQWGFRSLMDLITKYTGCTFEWITIPLTNYIQYCAPTRLPTTADAQALWLAGYIDEPTRDCLTRCNGDYDYWQSLIALAKRVRPNPNELTALWMRKLIPEAQFNKQMLENGVKNKEDLENFKKLAISFPGLGDVISFLVRDVSDADLVKEFNLDADFEKKWQGDLIRYAEALGVTPELAKYYWRAHWKIPSPTQLFEMLHRLRPDRVPPNIATTPEQVKHALQQDDVAPFWVDRIMATSYRPINRTDAQRAYAIGAFNEAQLKSAFLDEGYNNEDADLMVRFSVRQNQVSRARKAGLPTGRELINRYVGGQISAEDLTTYLKDLGFTDQEAKDAIKWGGRKIRSNSNKEAIACLKKKYLAGLVGKEQAEAQLSQITGDKISAGIISDGWCKMMTSKGKELSAVQLCELYQRNLITGAVYQTSLVNLGYSIDRAKAIIALCTVKGEEKQAQATKRQLEDARRARERAKKEDEKKKKEDEKKAKEAEKKKPAEKK